MTQFKEQAVLITGASSGIGKAAASVFAAQGADLVLSDVSVPAGEELAESIRAQGGKAIFVPADVSDEQQVKNLVAESQETFRRLDVMVNCAGIGGDLGLFHETSTDLWHRIIAVNQTGVFFCMKAALPVMVGQGKGAIVNVASLAGIGAAPLMGAYAASKHAVVGMTKAAASEYGKFGIRVNAVCPTIIRTPMAASFINAGPTITEGIRKAIPLKRFGEPEEVAQTIAWLGSDLASYINGAAVPVDGGQRA